MDERRDLTPGDPLGATGPGPAGPAPAPPRGAEHYGGGRVPPGAFAARTHPGAPGVPLVLAGWGQRALATIIDGIIVGAITLLVLAVGGIGFFAGEDTGFGALIVSAILATIVFAVLSLVYAPLLMARTNGQTLGRMATGCRVVRADGRPTDFWWSALREVVVKGLVVGIAASATGGIAYLVDVLWPIPDKENRALHDMVVDSRVVKA